MFAPSVCAHEHDIRNATGTSMLKRIIEDDHITPGLHRVVGAGETIGRDDDRHVRVEGTMDERLVLPIAPQHDRWLCARTFETAGKVRRERRLARSSYCEIPDTQRGNCGWVYNENA